MNNYHENMKRRTVDPYKIVRGYLNELFGPQGVHSTSHYTLFELYQKHTRIKIVELLDQYWKQHGPNGLTDPFNEYA